MLSSIPFTKAGRVTVNLLIQVPDADYINLYAAVPIAVSRGPRALVQCIAVNVRCLLATFKKGAGDVCRRLEDTSSKRKLGEQTGSD
jgi:hypothetical protein